MADITRRQVTALLGAGVPLTFAPQPASAEARRGSEGFASGGVTITVERYDPSSDRRASRPAVLVLHGSDGPGERYSAAARRVAAAGYRVFLVHYLDRTGERRASYSSIASNFAAWASTVQDAVTWIQGQPGVDGRRIGVLGVSLGGGLAIAEAARDPRIAALVDYYGFVPPSVGSGLGSGASLPPTLILHGDADRVVPVSNANTLDSLLAAQGVPHETVIYPGEGHGFSAAAQADASRRITAFFGRTLGGGAQARG